MFDTLFGIGRTTSSVLESTEMDPEIAGISIDTVEECFGDPFEYAVAAVYENEMFMKNIETAIMVCEYAYLKENGTEMVYESSVLKNMWSKIKAAIKKAWEKICAFFKKVMNWVSNIVKSDKKFAEKYEKLIKDIPGGKVPGFEYKGYDYQILKPQTMIKNVATVVKNKVNIGVGASAKEENIDKILDSVRGDILGTDSVSADDFDKKLKDVLCGSTDTVDIASKKSLDSCISEIKSAKDTKAALKAAYETSRATVNVMIKQANEQEKYFEREEKNNDGKTAENAAAKAKANQVAATIFNKCIAILTTINNKGAKIITANNRQNKSLLTAAVNKYNKDKKGKDSKGSTNESFVDGVFDMI